MNVSRTALVSVLVCALGFAAARGGEVVYLSNFTNTFSGSFANSVTYPMIAQRFQPGNHAGGYILSSVMLNVNYDTSSGAGEIVVRLRANSGANSPGTVLATLSGASPTNAFLTNLVYSAPSGVVLQHDAKYWISVEGSGAAEYNWRFAGTNYNVFDAQDGWALVSNGTNNTVTYQNRAFYLEVRCKEAIQYFQDFSGAAVGATSMGDGSTLSSTSLGTAAEVQDGVYKSLQMTTSGVANTRSTFLLPDLDPGQTVNAFSAKWLAEMYGNYPTAGQGWSVNFGKIGALSLTSTAYEQETGFDVGLTLSVKTSTNNPGFYLLVNGATIASSTFDPATLWGVNTASNHYFELDWHYSDGITLRVNGQTIFSGVSTYGFIPQPGDRFVWAARTSNATERIRFDNILVATGGNLKRESVSTPYVASPGSLGSAIAFDGVFSVNSTWQDFSPPTGYVGGKLSTNRTIVAFAVTCGSSRPADPRLWSLEGSRDGGTTFTNCMSTGGVFSAGGMTLCAPSTNAESYDVFRLNIATNGGNLSVINVSEFSLYSFTPVAGPASWNLVDGTTNTLTGGGLSISISADDGRMLAGFYYDNLYRSVSNDTVWTSVSGTQTDTWYCVRIAGSGQYQYALKFPAIYRSANSGSSFSQVYGSAVYWDELEVSENGAVLAAVDRNSATYLAYSTDYAVSWSFATSMKLQYWSDVDVSADGTRIVATSDRGTNAALPGNIWLSTNSGSTWAQTTAPSQRWQTVTMSDDGLRIYAAATNSPNSAVIYRSTNGGTSWQQSAAPVRGYKQLACSSDGIVIAALSSGSNSITLSLDGGVNWATLQPEGATSFDELAISGDGGHLAAIDFYGIYNYRFQFRPPTITDRPGFYYNYASQSDLYAYINPNGLPSKAWVALGPTPSLGQTNFFDIGSGSANVNVVSTFSNLNSGTTYYYRFFATNRTGIVRSGDLLSFNTTEASPAGFEVSLNGPQITGVVTGSFYGIYFIQHSPTLNSPSWQTIATNNNGITTSSPLTINLSSSNGFYRAISK